MKDPLLAPGVSHRSRVERVSGLESPSSGSHGIRDRSGVFSAGAQGPSSLSSGPASTSQQLPDLGQWPVPAELQLCTWKEGTS